MKNFGQNGVWRSADTRMLEFVPWKIQEKQTHIAKITIVLTHASIGKKLEGLEIFAVIEKSFSLEKIKRILESLKGLLVTNY